MKTLLFTIAHKVKANFANFSEALKYAWKVIKLKSRMTKAVVAFKFKKVDGSIREAVGTLQKSIVPQTKGIGSSPAVFTYFDMDKNEYRCAKIESLII